MLTDATVGSILVEGYRTVSERNKDHAQVAARPSHVYGRKGSQHELRAWNPPVGVWRTVLNDYFYVKSEDHPKMKCILNEKLLKISQEN